MQTVQNFGYFLLFNFVVQIFCKDLEQQLHEPTGNLQINGNLNVKNAIGAEKLQTEEFQSYMLEADGNLITNNLFIDKADVQNLEVDTFISLNQNNENYIEIDSDVIVTSIHAKEHVNFVNLNQQNQEQNIIRDWQLVHHDHFQNEESYLGWNLQVVNFCNNNFNNFQDQEQNVKYNLNDISESPFNKNQESIKKQIQNNKNEDMFLGGHCLTSTESLTKTYTQLQQHTSIKIQASVHLFDKWEGESLYLYADNQKVWEQQSKSIQQQIPSVNICGDSHPDQAFGIPVDIIIPHNSEQLTIEFKSNLEKNACVASFAIDNVIISLK